VGYATTNIVFSPVTLDGKFSAADYDNHFGLGAVFNWYGVVFAASAQDAADFVAGNPLANPVLNTYGATFAQLSGVWASSTDFFSLFGSGEGLDDYDGSGVLWSLSEAGQAYPYLPSCDEEERITEDGETRITEDGETRIIQ